MPVLVSSTFSFSPSLLLMSFHFVLSVRHFLIHIWSHITSCLRSYKIQPTKKQSREQITDSRERTTMEMKREVRVEKENDKEENMLTALLTALIILSMACLKHFSSLTYFIEQWRSLVFLLLNIVLLAVYFTSTRLTPGESHSHDFKTRQGGSRLKMMRSKKKKRASFDQDFVETKEVIKNCVVEEVIEEKIKRVCPEFNETTKDCFFEKKVVDLKAEEEELEAGRLSNEELNERVEAFITTFRQHLVIDARRGRDKDRKEMSRRRESNDQKMRSNDSNEISFLARRVSCSV